MLEPAVAVSFWDKLIEITKNMPIVFSSVHFMLFLPLAVAGYFAFPKRFRRVWLLLASYYFYFFAAPKYLVVLVLGTVFSYIMARLIGGAKSAKIKKAWLTAGVLGSLLVLCFFKFNRFFAFLQPLYTGLNITDPAKIFSITSAVGISYYTFTSIAYLIDISRGDIPAEKNFVVHALFLGFFPTVAMGPIARAGKLMPQLKDNSRQFCPKSAAEGLRRMALGFFKKLAVADLLSIYANAVYEDLGNYTGLSLTFAAVLFALHLYFDFSGYTDIAMGSAKLLGIEIPQNFNTPYFATNFSGFWARWHMSFSSFLQDYIFTPLVWSRWVEKIPFIGKKVKNPPVLSSLLVVFMVSGIWHGDTLCYVVWGLLQAIFRIGEELLHRTLGKPKKKPSRLRRISKTVFVFVLWVESLVFFRVGWLENGTVKTAITALMRQFQGVSLAQTGREIYACVAPMFLGKSWLVCLFFVFAFVCLSFAIWADWMQCFRLKGKCIDSYIATLKPAVRWVFYYGVIVLCFVGFLLQNGGFDGASFAYGGY